MKHPSATVIAVTVALFASDLGCSCIGGKNIPRTYPEPSVEQVLAHLSEARQRVQSFQTGASMDSWVGDDRLKLDKVLLMGRVGAFMRLNAEGPGGKVVADLACNGAGFKYIDYSNDCQLTGPCNRESIAQLLRISLESDDLLMLIAGMTPIIDQAQGTLEWDAKNGREVLRLTNPDQSLSQTITLDGTDRRWDVLSSEVSDRDGRKLWTLRNKDFRSIKGEDGTTARVPDKTQFKQPQDKTDLLFVRKEDVLDTRVNPFLDDNKFQMDIPHGLARCGAKSAASTQPAK